MKTGVFYSKASNSMALLKNLDTVMRHGKLYSFQICKEEIRVLFENKVREAKKGMVYIGKF